MTNGDRIRAMTDEELAVWMLEHVDCGEGCPIFRHICNFTGEDCEIEFLQWLKMEGEDG